MQKSVWFLIFSFYCHVALAGNVCTTKPEDCAVNLSCGPLIIADAPSSNQGANTPANGCYPPPIGKKWVAGTQTFCCTQDSHNEGSGPKNDRSVRIDGKLLCLNLEARPLTKTGHAYISGQACAQVAPQ